MRYRSDRESSYWLYPLLVEKRIDFINKMKDNGIPVSVVHLGIDKNMIFGGKDYSLVNQRYFDEGILMFDRNLKYPKNKNHIFT
jgi:hypothetical protein